jgi:3-oxocholest-4-en-26-oyl-CoA dehydrogenase beta subunit
MYFELSQETEAVAELATRILTERSTNDVVGEVGANSPLPDVLLHAEAGLASMQSGVCATALKMSAEYTSEREQFGRPIASFQAVAQRVADGYIDAEAVRLTSLHAAWRLAEGLDAVSAVAIAKWWAADGGHRVLHAAQHVHGGVGLDVEYPLHRFFRLGKQIEFTLGHGTAHLQRIGRELATEPV